MTLLLNDMLLLLSLALTGLSDFYYQQSDTPPLTFNLF
jgi:hypothetical protein